MKPARQPMSGGKLFLVIVAALLFVLVALPVGCSTAGMLAFLGLAKTAGHSAPAEPAVVAAPAAAAAPEAEPLARALARRVTWPATLAITQQHGSGAARLVPGQTFRGVAMMDDGQIVGRMGDRAVLVPFEKTDLLRLVERGAP